MKRNFYKIDEYCFVVSILCAIVAFLFLFGGYTIFFFIFISSTVILFFIGRYFRKKEKLLIRLSDIITNEGSVTTSHLAMYAGVPFEKIMPMVGMIVRQNYPMVKMEGDCIKFAIAGSVTITHTCSSCGAPSKHDITIQNAIPDCPYCGSPVDSESITNARQELLDDALKTSIPQQEKPKMKLSIPLLIFLSVIGWPLAIFYLIIYFKSNSGAEAFTRSVYTQFTNPGAKAFQATKRNQIN
jgi:hypothetical protein